MKKEFFYNKLSKLLGNEAEAFFKALELDLNKGIRLNSLKIKKDAFTSLMPFEMEAVKWCSEGFYLSNMDERPSKHPYYYAGLYYLQEPSAMFPVEAMEIRPGDKVLDISAAPGGKSTQIAAKLNNQGVLVTNDINPKRTIALQKNISLFGVKNSIVTNQRPEALAGIFNEYFDKALVDAPCSGEGQIKKDFNTYQSDNQKYVDMQKEILSSVKLMVKGGGEIVYSTCTFSPEENEGIIQWFTNENKEFDIIDINISDLSYGRPEWLESCDNAKALKRVRRAWPHKLRGEGHFVARLRKKSDEKANKANIFRINNNSLDAYYEFAKEYNLDDSYISNVHSIDNQLYLIPSNMIDLKNIKTVGLGLYLGEIKNNKFSPSQELALTLNKNNFNNIVNLASDDVRVMKYLKGETIEIDKQNNWCLVCVDGYGLGWGKANQAMLKNFYKKQWRML